MSEMAISPKRILVACKDCCVQLNKRLSSMKEWQGRCRSCAYKYRFKDLVYAAKQMERAREQCLRQKGIPNAKKFTSENVRGEKGSNWKGGITPMSRLMRARSEQKQWARDVKARDNFTCCKCGYRGGDLHSDHISPFSTHPELRLDLNNGRTLCVACHRSRKTWDPGYAPKIRRVNNESHARSDPV